MSYHHNTSSASSEESPAADHTTDSLSDPVQTPESEPDEVPRPLSPRNSHLSLVSSRRDSYDDRFRLPRDDPDAQSLTRPDLFRLFNHHGDNYEVKQVRKLLRAALDRMDDEKRRREEAEQRALEMAHRFKVVNDARVTAQQEVERLKGEVRLHAVQLENAQREIMRGSEIIRDIEAQRDDAEAAAARARSTARRLKEEQLVMLAREEGRKKGFQEGLRRGYEEARSGRYDSLPLGEPPMDAGPRTEPLDGLPSMLNLPTPSQGAVPLAPPSLSNTLDEQIASVPDRADDPYGGGPQGSRFHEILRSPGASSFALSSAAPTTYARPTTSYGDPISARHTMEFDDGFIPTIGADNRISLPPPHEMQRQASPSIGSVPLTATSADYASQAPSASTYNGRDYAYRDGRRSPSSVAESLPSTSYSQFELVNSPGKPSRALRGKQSGLSAIAEVSSTMELSPPTTGRVRSAIIPEPLNFPAPGSEQGPFSMAAAGQSSRRDEENQELAGNLRFSDPAAVDEWRRSTMPNSAASGSSMAYSPSHRPKHIITPEPLYQPSPEPGGRPPSAHRRSRSAQSPPANGRLGTDVRPSSQRRSSSQISIHIEPPSGPASTLSPNSSELHQGMLTPDGSRQHLPPAQPQYSHSGPPDPTDHSYAYGMSPAPGFPIYRKASPDPLPRKPPSPRRSSQSTLGGTWATHPPPFHAAPSSSSYGDQIRPISRSASTPYEYDPSRSRPPSARPSDPYGSSSTRSKTPGRQQAPSPGPGGRYQDQPSRVPSVLRSPSRASSQVSLQPDMARPSSRGAAEPPQRSLSMHAGSTPAMVARPLSGGGHNVHRVPSASSINSDTSRKSGSYTRFDKNAYVDPAYLASSDDLSSMQSPHTKANTRVNAQQYGPGPSRLREASSPALSYASFGD